MDQVPELFAGWWGEVGLDPVVPDPLVDDDEASLLEKIRRKIIYGLRNLAYRPRSFLLTVGLLLIYQLSLEEDLTSSVLLTLLTHLNSFGAAWGTRLVSLRRSKLMVFIGKTFHMFFKAVRYILPSRREVVDRCEGGCREALGHLETQLREQVHLLGDTRERLELGGSGGLAGADAMPDQEYSLGVFLKTVEHISTLWIMLTLIFTLAKNDRPSPHHLIAVAATLKNLIPIYSSLITPTTTSQILDGVAEGMQGIYQLFGVMAAEYGAKLHLLADHLWVLKPYDNREDTSLTLYRSNNLDTIHSSFMVTSLMIMFLFGVFIYFILPRMRS